MHWEQQETEEAENLLLCTLLCMDVGEASEMSVSTDGVSYEGSSVAWSAEGGKAEGERAHLPT